MNVTCTGCPAKYSVPDEKVRGKKVRITCKHCGTNIVVDGSALEAASQSAEPQVEATEPEPASPVATPPTAAESTWLVGFVDERQEQHSTSELVALYGSGKIDDETLVWKDGMDDWLSPFDVPEIAAVLKQRGVARRTPALAPPSNGDDEATVVARSPIDDETVVSSAPSEIVAAAVPAKTAALPAVAAARQSTPEIKPSAAAIRQSTPEIKPSAAAIRQSVAEIKPAVAAKPAAARRAEKRPEVDLFGGVAEAGSEADTSLDFGVPDEPAHKMTGARNESSVLFSLDALTKPDPKAASQKKTQDKKQEDQAAAALFGDSAPNSLMNMGGGGGLAALAAPDFTKPVAAAPDPVRPSDPVEVPNTAPKKKGGAGVLLGIVIGVAAAAGVGFVVMSKKPPADKPAESNTANATAAATAPTVPSAAAEAVSAAPEAASAAPAASEAIPSASAASVASAKPAVAAGTSVAAVPAAAAAAVNKPADKPAEAKKPDTAAAPPAGADFDKSAAIAALGAAAANASSCKKPDGPTGGGKASVTFAPSGRATNSTVSGALAGTDVGGCVARVFRAARVPPFAGDAVTVSKSFSVE
jgi:predicted Zn finger-like uncharacterized protein